MLDPLPTPNSAALILVVDDEIRNIQVVGSLLLKHGHEVIGAASGVEALAKLQSARPDLILMDVMMPGMTGFELCRRLRADPELREIPVVFLSAATDKSFIMEALEVGGVDYITKPFYGPELISRVELHANRKKTHRRLAQVIREKNRLLEVVAHDLKNPLSGIQFAATMLAENPELPAGMRQNLVDSISDSATRAFEIVSGLLETRGLEEAKATIATAPIPLREHAEKAAQYFGEHLKSKRIHLRFRRSEDVLVLADDRSLLCCLENLISNAIKFSPHESAVELEVFSTASHGVFRIADEGPGIRDDEVDLLFQKFTRLSARPTGGEVSTGLGLHIVHELVNAMGGSVVYEKNRERGACFVIRLPVGVG